MIIAFLQVVSSLEARLKLAQESWEAAEAKLRAETNTTAKLQQCLVQAHAAEMLANAQVGIGLST